MITQERLKELIEQGATIYNVCCNQVFEEKLMSNHFVGIADDKVSLMQRYNGYEQSLVDYIDNLYETKAEAEWQAEFGRVEETIKLELPKFEDFREPIGFMGKDNIKYYILKWQDCICIWGNDNVFRLICEYTKKNYTTVCEYAKALFLKGKE